jgi:hypothetical protein
VRDSTVLPDLRVLPVERLLPHEEHDPRRVARLAERLGQEGLLKNPPVVAAISGAAIPGAAIHGADIPGSECYAVLDGANRSLAFAALGIPHIVAQLVDYERSGVILDTWYHVVAGMALEAFEAELTQVTGLHLEACSLQAARKALDQHQAAAYIVCAEGVRLARNTTRQLRQDTRLLKDLVRAYRGKADIYRASNDVWELQSPYYPDITALVIFPRLCPQDILAAAISDVKIPTGITRHIIPHRALNINISLEVLAADWPLEQKEAWLHNWLMERMAANAIRFYSESTFSFNE